MNDLVVFFVVSFISLLILFALLISALFGRDKKHKQTQQDELLKEIQEIKKMIKKK